MLSTPGSSVPHIQSPREAQPRKQTVDLPAGSAIADPGADSWSRQTQTVGALFTPRPETVCSSDPDPDWQSSLQGSRPTVLNLVSASNSLSTTLPALLRRCALEDSTRHRGPPSPVTSSASLGHTSHQRRGETSLRCRLSAAADRVVSPRGLALAPPIVSAPWALAPRRLVSRQLLRLMEAAIRLRHTAP